jgi:hypothetical protein
VRTVFGVDQLAADVEADLAARGVVADVLIGEWNTEHHYGEPRVVFGRGGGKIEDPTGDRFGATGWIDLGNGTVARALLHRAKVFPVWVHSVAPPKTPPKLVAQEARRATDALLDATLAAIRRTRGGMVMGWTDEEPVNDSEKRGEFVYGSIVAFGVVLAVPVFDDPTPVASADEVEAEAQLEVDGTPVPTSPETLRAP